MSTSQRTAAIIVAAGRGMRAGGGVPKQYRPLEGRPVLAWSIDAFAHHPRVDEVVVVTHPDDAARFDALPRPCGGAPLHQVAGGASRTASVRAGLKALSAKITRVLIHDGARPLVSGALIESVLDALTGHPGAAPALMLGDALWRGAGGRVLAIQPRGGLYRAQTPQGFRAAEIRAAHAAWTGAAADDVEVALAAGLDVAIVAGEESNIKITTAADFGRARRLMGGKLDIRTGNGFDVHRFASGNAVTLCGVEVAHTHGLIGHSDADVGIHAITDAILGALAEGDIGWHFPPGVAKWQGAASRVFLEFAMDRIAARGFTLANIDCTLICERPKIGPHVPAMRAALADICKVSTGRISVKATTTEGLGFAGRKEGIAAQATVTLVSA